ncbi:hypothetical protein ACOMHN_000156 [Nucella lapillus]
MMRQSSSDDAKVRKRRQQKRDYASRKRQHDKLQLGCLQMQHKKLSRRSRRQRQQIEQLRAWASYARSFLSLCCQVVVFQAAPATPLCAPTPPTPPSPPEQGAVQQTDPVPVAGRAERPQHPCQVPQGPAESGRQRQASVTWSEDSDDQDSPPPHLHPHPQLGQAQDGPQLFVETLMPVDSGAMETWPRSVRSLCQLNPRPDQPPPAACGAALSVEGLFGAGLGMDCSAPDHGCSPSMLQLLYGN